MVAVWLYAADGRQLYYVAVPTPMPASVTYAGLTFDWNAKTGRYEQVALPLGYAAAPAAPDLPQAGPGDAPR